MNDFELFAGSSISKAFTWSLCYSIKIEDKNLFGLEAFFVKHPAHLPGAFSFTLSLPFSPDRIQGYG
jgi:hypothetical protein